MTTAELIDNKEFKKALLFGYNKDDVNAFLRDIGDEVKSLQAKYDALYSENEIAKNNLRENSVKIYELEKQLEQAAPGAKKEANAANAEANKIINDAKKRANDVLAGAKAELAKLKAEMEEIKANGGMPQERINVGGPSATTTATATASTPAFDESALDEPAVDPITAMKMKSKTQQAPQKLKMGSMKKEEEPKPQAFAGRSAVKEDEDDIEEVIIGEIDETVNRNQVLIGDGDEDADFEFL